MDDNKDSNKKLKYINASLKIVSELDDQVNLILSKIQLEKQKKLSQDKINM